MRSMLVAAAAVGVLLAGPAFAQQSEAAKAASQATSQAVSSQTTKDITDAVKKATDHGVKEAGPVSPNVTPDTKPVMDTQTKK